MKEKLMIERSEVISIITMEARLILGAGKNPNRSIVDIIDNVEKLPVRVLVE